MHSLYYYSLGKITATVKKFEIENEVLLFSSLSLYIIILCILYANSEISMLVHYRELLTICSCGLTNVRQALKYCNHPVLIRLAAKQKTLGWHQFLLTGRYKHSIRTATLQHTMQFLFTLSQFSTW